MAHNVDTVQSSEELERLLAAQAEDEGLWFIARTAPEAYLQQELRKLHAAVEAAVSALRKQNAQAREALARIKATKCYCYYHFDDDYVCSHEIADEALDSMKGGSDE